MPKKKQNKQNDSSFWMKESLHLSDERTFLAYIRTALAVFVVGITLVKLFPQAVSNYFGYLFIVSSIVVLFIGITEYNSEEKKIDAS